MLRRPGNPTWSGSSNISSLTMSRQWISNVQYFSVLYIGGQTYQLMRNLLAPTKPTEVTIAEIVAAVQKHVHLARLLLSSGLTFIPGADNMWRISQHTWPNYANYLSTVTSEQPSTICSGIGWCVVSRINVSSSDCWQNRTSLSPEPY